MFPKRFFLAKPIPELNSSCEDPCFGFCLFLGFSLIVVRTFFQSCPISSQGSNVAELIKAGFSGMAVLLAGWCFLLCWQACFMAGRLHWLAPYTLFLPKTQKLGQSNKANDFKASARCWSAPQGLQTIKFQGLRPWGRRTRRP